MPARPLRYFCCVIVAHHSCHSPQHCSLTAHVRANVASSMKKAKPGAPHLPKLLRLSVPVRQAHIEDMYGEYPVEKRDALCST